MGYVKRIFLFLVVNFLVVATISLLLHFLQVRPFLQSHGIDYGSLLTFCLVWGMAGALISLALSRIMAKWLLRVRVIDPLTDNHQHQQILQMVHELAKRAGLTAMPQVGIYASSEANAFATGPTRSRALVAVSSGLIDRVSAGQLEAILAHEISHVANGDMVTMALLQGVVNAFVMFLARALAFVLSGIGQRGGSDSSRGSSYGAYMVMVFIFELLFMILGSIVVASYSRRREFRADAGGARLAGKDKMIAALEGLRAILETRSHPSPVAATQATGGAVASLEALKISTPRRQGYLKLFATHPPLEERIAHLQRIPN